MRHSRLSCIALTLTFSAHLVRSSTEGEQGETDASEMDPKDLWNSLWKLGREDNSDTGGDGRNVTLPPSTNQMNNLDVVLLRSQKAKSIFRPALQKFRLPEKGTQHLPYAMAWANLIKDLEKQDLQEDHYIPILVMNGETPCAAALCLDARGFPDIQFSTLFLMKMVRNAGEDCNGAAEAMLCNMIHHSTNRFGEFNALRLDAYDEPKLRSYYESFGCVPDEFQFANMACPDPHPHRCIKHSKPAFNGDDYFTFTHDFSSALGSNEF